MDLILSSGFLAFSRHLGVLDALSGRGLTAEAVVGTSSGALVGALVQAGQPLSAVSELLGRQAPLRSMLPSARPWRGLFSTRRIASTLSRYLPERFEDLERPFAVGVADQRGRHLLLHSGRLLPAVLASMAIPWIFPAVGIAGQRWVDGGVADRVGVAAWRHWRPGRSAIVHVVERSRGRDVPFEASGCCVIRTPRAAARFWSLGDFAGQRAEARVLAEAALAF